MFDPRCFDLAEIFLSDEPSILQNRANELAQTIQDAIEEWIQDNRPTNQMRFLEVRCSQCGQTFGPANSGYSHCQDHVGILPVSWHR